MKDCKKCKRSIEDSMIFCPYCGEKYGLPTVCSKCGEVIYNAEYKFCGKCGTSVEPAALKGFSSFDTNNIRSQESFGVGVAKNTEVKKYDGTVEFGRYFRYNDASKEPITWKVLAKEGDKILLLSEYGLDCKPYNDERKETTWEKCTLRKWLNDEFIKIAFSEDELKKICSANVPADRNPKYFKADPGNATVDKVFLLSSVEAKKYLSKYKCIVTDYAYTRGVVRDDDGVGEWWLRTPGDSQKSAVSVMSSFVYDCGTTVSVDNIAVRPAIWVTL